MAGEVYSGEHSNSISDFYRSIQSLNQGQLLSMILIGSVARATETHRSDVDLLILGDRQITAPSSPSKFHVYFSTKGEFLQKLQEGDDFAAWSIRYGIPLEDNGIWGQIGTSPQAQVWPDWRKKIKHSIRRLILGAQLLEIGDAEAASEELLFAVGHAARAVLLRANVFPLSRSELIAQSKSLGYIHVASLLEKLIYDEPKPRLLLRAQWYTKKLLCNLNRDTYQRISAESSAITKKKVGVRQT